MTGTNHALTGAVIALAVKKPELAIPLAFLSHFVLDAIPHYNPPNVQRKFFTNFSDGWAKKLAFPSFRAIFAGDMLLLLLVISLIPLAHPLDISPWTIFFSMLAAISPDFIGGRFFIYRILKIPKKPNKISWFTGLHHWFQWMERPWGIFVEIAWFFLMLLLIHNLVT